MRISAGSVPVKDRYREKGRVIGKNSRCIEPKKNAASEGALRRVERENEVFVAERPRSELRRILRRRVGHIAVAIEPLARGFGDSIAKHVAQLGAIRLALLAQFFQPHGIGCQFSTLGTSVFSGVSVGPQAVSTIAASRNGMIFFMVRVPRRDQGRHPASAWQPRASRWLARAR